MKAELSNAPVWMVITPEILALDAKTARIVDHEGPARVNLTVTNGDPSGENNGKCSVRAWQSIMTGEPQWNSPGEIPRTQETHNWRGYLNQAAVEILIEDQKQRPEELPQLNLTEAAK
jgi:hypothetical protein